MLFKVKEYQYIGLYFIDLLDYQNLKEICLKFFTKVDNRKTKKNINKMKTYNISTIIFGTKISMYNNIFLKTYEYSLGI